MNNNNDSPPNSPPNSPNSSINSPRSISTHRRSSNFPNRNSPLLQSISLKNSPVLIQNSPLEQNGNEPVQDPLPGPSRGIHLNSSFLEDNFCDSSFCIKARKLQYFYLEKIIPQIQIF